MLADPQTVTVNAVAQVMPSVLRGTNESKYSEEGGPADPYSLHISHQSGARHRRLAKLTQTKVAVDPLTSENFTASASVYLVIDEPISGFSDVELGDIVAGFVAWLTVATVDKILGGES